MTEFDTLKNNKEFIEKQLRYRFKSPQLLFEACIHSSYINEHRSEELSHNERLEFLGDAVLGLVIADSLYFRLKMENEGVLSLLKSQLVEAKICMEFIDQLGLADFLLMGKGEKKNLGSGRQTLMADFFEAIIGAIYSDGGYLIAKEFFLAHFKEKIDQIIDTPLKNPKIVLQDFVQKTYKKLPEYVLLSETGPGHEKLFEIAVYVNGEKIAEGQGASKKKAQLDAAEKALNILESHDNKGKNDLDLQ